MGRRNSKPQFPATISNDHFQKEKIESPALFDTSSNNGFKKRALVNSLRTLKVVRQMGLEPIRSRTRPSNVPVCQFQHCRAPIIIHRKASLCQSVIMIVFERIFPSRFVRFLLQR